jgi:pyridinium-3,5-biscarboxylic acid mononucleotide synthase
VTRMWERKAIEQLLSDVAAGRVAVGDAVRRLGVLPYEQLECATVDHHRNLRQGFAEVIFCEPKSPGEVAEIAARLAAAHPRVLGTRATQAHYESARERVPGLEYDERARSIWLDREPREERMEGVVIVSAGTGDGPVAAEAALTLRLMGHEPRRINDVGVAGLHRLLAHIEELQRANAIVCVAGMEGALPSVVGGLVGCPVIAVPTSVGYGASFGGVAALLGMLNSCAAGVAVVNIDNGYGAGHLAAIINNAICASTNG